MKKRFLIALIATLFLISNVPTAFANDEVTIIIDGSSKGKIPAPVESNGVLMFPMAEIFKAAGYDVFPFKESNGVGAVVHYAGLGYGAFSGVGHFDVFDEADENYIRTTEFVSTPIMIGKESVGVSLDYMRYEVGLAVTWDGAARTVRVNNAASKPQDIYEDDTIGNYGVYLKINDSRMSLCNYIACFEKKVDISGGTTPVVKGGRTLLPIATLIEALGGTSSWDSNERKVSLALNGNKVDVLINKSSAVVNGKQRTLDVQPIIMNGRTMVPLRFVTENLGLELVWDGNNQIIIIYQPWFKNEMFFNANIYSGWFVPVIKETIPVPEKPAPPVEQKPVKPQPEPNTTDPLDSKGNLIHVTDIVAAGMFYGEVEKINGSKVYVFWNDKSQFIPKGDESFWAIASGVKYGARQWMEASQVTIESSGY